MSTANPRQIYHRAMRDQPSLGITSGLRPEPTMDEARAELSEEIVRIATYILKHKYGPLLGAVSQPTVIEFLKDFELNLSRAKGDLTVVFEDLFDRVIQKNQGNKK